jgi:peptidyl-prolyl cis-trans isomerase D
MAVWRLRASHRRKLPMFDLFRSREKTVRYLLGALLLLVAASMVITLVPGFGSGIQAEREGQTIAEIGGEKLTAPEIVSAIQREIRQSKVSREMAQFYVPLYVQQAIAERAVAYQAKRMGFQVSDTELAAAIRSLVPSLYENGKFVGNDAYAAYLRQVNMSIPEFEDSVRNQILLSRLENLTLEGVVVPPAEVEEQYKLKFERFKIAYFGVRQDKALSEVKAAPEELKAYFEQSKSRYTIPESRQALIFAPDVNKLAANVKLDEGALRAAYQAQISRFRTEDRVKVRHILLKTQDKPKEEVEKQRKKADALLAQLKAGADFADLAKKNSEDPGSASSGGDLGFIVKGQTVPEFERTAYTLNAGELSSVISTMYGFHILKVEAKEAAKVTPFEQARAELAAEVAKDTAQERVRRAADEIRLALTRSEAEAMRVAATYGVVPQKAEKARPGEPLPEVGSDENAAKAVFTLPAGGISNVIEIGDSGQMAAVIKVLQHYPSRPAEFAEVQDAVAADLKATRAAQWMTSQLRAVTEKLKSGADFTATAKSIAAEIKTPQEFNRDQPIEGLGMATQFSAALDKNAGEWTGPMEGQGGSYFIKVVEKIPADMTKFAAERDQYQLNLKARKARERKELFNDGLVQMLIKEGKVKVYDNAIKLLAQNFRN